MRNKITDFDYSLKRRYQRQVLTGVFYVILLYIILALLLKFIIFPVYSISDSMFPTIEKGNCIFFTPLKVEKNIKAGDIVYVSKSNIPKANIWKRAVDSVVSFVTLQKVFPFKTKNVEQCFLRRVIGTPGDTAYVKDYMVYIKSKDSSHFLTEHEIIQSSYETITKNQAENIDVDLGTPGNVSEIVLGEDEYFLLCDNRIEGIDSRLWGVVSKKQIKGCAFLRYFPFKQIRSF
ncbi:MAG: signal peptidase I [Treponema sp.]|mgnify:CR=1 FL=1|nr:signal peptidase I [Treponema sp.]